jgi:hypothetical protein
MKNLKKGIWFPIVLVLLVAVIALWYPFRYGNAFLYNLRLLNNGVIENARIVQKGIVVNETLKWVEPYLTEPSDDHHVQVELNGGYVDQSFCQFGVSKTFYDSRPVGMRVPITFLADEPEKCKLASGISGTQNILIVGMSVSTFMLLIALGALFYISRSYKKPDPGNPNRLTTEMEFENPLNCPQCNENMIEGYMPMGFGIHWRRIDHPVGIPNIFSVLPGTIFWFKRPKLHAYHCERCKIVTFQYGKE